MNSARSQGYPLSRAAERVLTLAARPRGYVPVVDGPWWAWFAPWVAHRLVTRLAAEGALIPEGGSEKRPLYRAAMAPPPAAHEPPPLSAPDASELREILVPLALVALRHPPNPVRPDVYRTVRVRLDLLRQAQITVFGDRSLVEAWAVLEERMSDREDP